MDAICYGFKTFGQLSSDGSQSFFIQQNFSKENSSIKFVTFSWSKCYIVLEDGTVVVRGFVNSQPNSFQKLELPSKNVKMICCLRRYDLFLMEDGCCWKYSTKDGWAKVASFLFENNRENRTVKIVQLNSSDELHVSLTDSGDVYNFPLKVDMPMTCKIVKVSCGLEHYIALNDSGSVFVWGSGSRGQLGNGALNSIEQPELLIPLDGLYVIDVDAGGWHSAAVTNCGDLYTWGWNNFGQLGFLTDQNDVDENNTDAYVSVAPEPKLVDWPDNSSVEVKKVACGTRHTVVLLADGLAWASGCNKYKQINPFCNVKFFDQMTRVPIPKSIDQIYDVSSTSWYTILYVRRKS